MTIHSFSLPPPTTIELEGLPSINTLIDPDFVNWYSHGLPPSLARQLEGTYINLSYEHFLQPLKNYGSALTRDLARSEVKHAPAHGHTHSSRVVFGGDEALRKLEEIIEISLPISLKQHMKRALARHDFKHPGAPYHELVRPEHTPFMPSTLSKHQNEYSVEYVTSVWVDEENRREYPEDIAGRLLETYVIWSSTTRPSNAYSKRLGIDRINPKGFLGCLMAAADVRPTEELTYTLQFELDLFCIETMAFPLPKTRKEYIDSRKHFLSYISKRYDALDTAARRVAIDIGRSTDFSLTHLLGWRTTLAKVSEQIRQMEKGHDESWAIFNSLLMHHREATF